MPDISNEIKTSIEVAIAHTQNLFRVGLRLVLAQQSDLKVVGEAANGPQLLTLIRDLQPHVLLMDVDMPEMEVEASITLIAEVSPSTKTLLLMSHPDETTIFKCLEAGAKGYLSRDSSVTALIKAIHCVHLGEMWIERKVLSRFFAKKVSDHRLVTTENRAPEKELSPREREILCLLCKGLANKEIAEILFIHEKTVKGHLNSIFKKIGVSRRIQAILYAFQHGIH